MLRLHPVRGECVKKRVGSEIRWRLRGTVVTINQSARKALLRSDPATAGLAPVRQVVQVCPTFRTEDGNVWYSKSGDLSVSVRLPLSHILRLRLSHLLRLRLLLVLCYPLLHPCLRLPVDRF